jgi:hypothetical protein
VFWEGSCLLQFLWSMEEWRLLGNAEKLALRIIPGLVLLRNKIFPENLSDRGTLATLLINAPPIPDGGEFRLHGA